MTKCTLSILLVTCFSACTPVSLSIVNTLARFEDFTIYKNQAYGDHELNQLDIYIPKHTTPLLHPLPVVIFFYGGCWGYCATESKEDYLFVAQALSTGGYLTIIADYQQYPEAYFEQIMADAAMSVEWTITNIAKFGGDPQQLFLMGHSSGAHLAAMLTLNENYLQPTTYESIKGFIGLAGPYDFLPLDKPYQYELFGPEQDYPLSQPTNFVNGNEPPLLLLYGKNDQVVKLGNIVKLTKEILLYQGSVETHLYDDINHASILGALSIPFQNRRPILADIIHFLNRHSQSVN